MSKLEEVYNRRYKVLLIIPLLVLILSIFVILNFKSTHGDYINKDVSLSGGVSATVYLNEQRSLKEIEIVLAKELNKEVFVRELSTIKGDFQGVLIEISGIDADSLKSVLESNLNVKLNDENYFIEETGSNLGEDFYKQMMKAIITAFVLMGITIFIIFRKIIPSLAVIFSAFLDIVGTIALIDILNIRISSAGIAALLLLVGYSVDTDVLLATRMIKRKEGRVWERIVSSTKTGLTMTVTTLAATMIGYIFSISLVLKQMFIIIFLGLLVDVISTYLMNAGLLKWYLERKEGG